MGEDKKQNNNNEIKELIEKNIKLSEEILALTTKTRKYIFWQQVYSVIKILIFVVPIVIGIIYLPSLLRDLISQYGALFGLGNGSEQISPELLKQIPQGVLDQLSPDVLEQLKK